MTDTVLSGYRYVQIQYGDTLQAIAARELNDASKWALLIALNKLTFPYITGDTLVASATCRLYGETILVPASTAQVSAQSDPTRAFASDLLLRDGDLVASAAGDMTLVSGLPNLLQAISNRLATHLRELLFHLTYGNGAHDLKGDGNSPTDGLVGARAVKNALLADPRISDVPNMTAAAQGDALIITGQATPISGTSVDITTTV